MSLCCPCAGQFYTWMMAVIINLSRIFITGYLLFRHIVSNQFNILAGKPLFEFYDSSTKRNGLLSYLIYIPLPVIYAILVRSARMWIGIHPIFLSGLKRFRLSEWLVKLNSQVIVYWRRRRHSNVVPALCVCSFTECITSSGKPFIQVNIAFLITAFQNTCNPFKCSVWYDVSSSQSLAKITRQ